MLIADTACRFTRRRRALQERSASGCEERKRARVRQLGSSLWPLLRLRHLPGLMPSPSSHPRDPLHGVTLQTMVRQLVGRHGWEVMGWRIPIRCFQLDPSVKSSLTFLRKTPWARKKVEAWFAEEAADAPPDSKE